MNEGIPVFPQPGPRVHRVPLDRPWVWLARGWADFLEAKWPALAYGCTLVAASFALTFLLLFTGQMVGAEEALRIGLVSEVVPHDDLLPRVEALASEIAHGPTVAIETMKRLVRESMTADLAGHIEREEHLQEAVRQTEDFQEGVRSFLEKREPVFKGR